MTVSPGTVTYTCGTNGLTFPNGTCSTSSGAISVTNGATAAHIDVQGGNAIPSDNGTAWTLCVLSGTPACTGGTNGSLPGKDQFTEQVQPGSGNNSTGETFLTDTVACDTAFSGSSCPAAANASATEHVQMTEPSSSTDTSSSFTTTVTWTAVP